MTEDTWGGIKDPVLMNLMCIGIFKRTDRQDVTLNQTILAIRYSTAITLRILPRLSELETKVRVQQPLIKAAIDSLLEGQLGT